MYFKNIYFENVGPIENLNVEFPIEDGTPKPTIFIGHNGCGKSILLSFLVNFAISAKQEFYKNVEVEKGKVFKLRSPSYIHYGKHYYKAKLSLDNNIEYEEWVLAQARLNFEKNFKYSIIADPKWANIPEHENDLLHFSYQNNNSQLKELRNFVDQNVFLYFPPNRHEDPAWLNIHNLKYKASVVISSNIKGITDRNIICTNILTKLTNWLFDIIYDSRVFEVQDVSIPMKVKDGAPNYITGRIPIPGNNTRLISVITELLSLIFCHNPDERVQFNIGLKNNRRIGINILAGENIKTQIPNIFSLSSGESSLVALFLSVLRDYDLTRQNLSSTDDVKGIVIIDEIDAHLHSTFQYEMLPKLISKFPKVQFITTTHSPLFLLGLKETLGDNGFTSIELPTGRKTLTEEFSEFHNAFKYFIDTTAFRNSVEKQILNATKPKVLTEGKTDPIYLKTACELLGKNELLNKVDIEWVGMEIEGGRPFHTGDSALNHTKNTLVANPFLLKNQVLLLYDFDTDKPEEDIGLLHVRKINKNENNNLITAGIENLLPKELFEDRFYTERQKDGHYGKPTITYEFNKTKFCNWVCEERKNAVDFDKFNSVLDMIENTLIN